MRSWEDAQLQRRKHEKLGKRNAQRTNGSIFTHVPKNKVLNLPSYSNGQANPSWTAQSILALSSWDVVPQMPY